MSFQYAGVEFSSVDAFNRANLPPSFGGDLGTPQQLAMPPNRTVAEEQQSNMILYGGVLLAVGILVFVVT
jgi:hypothetical protein